MGLDLDKAVAQIYTVAERARLGQEEWNRHVSKALELLRNPPLDTSSLKLRISRARMTWLVPELTESLDAHHPAPDPLPGYTALATDGSHIDVDRHGPLACYLINIGSVMLRYGDNPGAILANTPLLYADEADLVLRDPVANGEQQVTGALLGVKRMVEECRALLEMARGDRGKGPTVGLLDGSLIPLGLVGSVVPDFVRRGMLEEGLLKVFSEFRALSEARPLALASYISYPRSTEVVNVLRAAICPHTPFPDCDLHCSRERSRNRGCRVCAEHPEGHRECDEVSELTDRHLFQRLLAPGERSGAFASRSSIVKAHYAEHEVYFFYIHVGEEVGRVEVPRWVATRPYLMELLHGVLLDQCRKGHGYPVALSEAHEQAVVTGADREEFWRMMDVAVGGSGLQPAQSAKGRSKTTRWV